MTAVDVMRMFRVWIYLNVEPSIFPCGLGCEVQEKRRSQGWHEVFWTE